jgi:hypothetical protein
VSYTLSSSGTSEVAYAAEVNTAATYKKLLRTWDETSRTFLIDTADDTTQVGTETFYIVITTRGNRKFYYQVKTTVECGNEIITYPGGAYTFTIE